MIQMKSGVYGGKNGMIRPKDGPFSLSTKEEARLVSREVAVYVPENCGVPIGFDETPPTVPGPPPELPELPDGVMAIPEYSVNMTPAELREIGKMCELTFKVGMTKEEMVAALDEFFETHMEDGEDESDEGEDAPTFDAAEAGQ